MRGPVLAVVLLGAVAAACAPGVAQTTPTPTPTSASTAAPMATDTPAPTDTATAAPTMAPITSPTVRPTETAGATASPAMGTPSAGCIDGWVAPQPGDDRYEEGLAIVSGTMGVEVPLEVEEMRYFTGPDAPWIIEPRRDVVERWYIKGGLAGDSLFRGRWLVEKRTETILGVAAVAPYDTQGFHSPDWVGFFGEGEPQAYEGLPGLWYGIPYDFVTGEGDTEQPGLPPEVIGCLDGT